MERMMGIVRYRVIRRRTARMVRGRVRTEDGQNAARHRHERTETARKPDDRQSPKCLATSAGRVADTACRNDGDRLVTAVPSN